MNFQCKKCNRVVNSPTKTALCATCRNRDFTQSKSSLDMSVEAMLWIADKSTAIEMALDMNRATFANDAEKAALYFAAWLAKGQHIISRQVGLAIAYSIAKPIDG
jgi:RNA polymerase subunit RPABC4/transcription elongation factor Spt4